MSSDPGNLTSRLVAAGSAVLLGLAGAGTAADPASASGHHPTPGAAGQDLRAFLNDWLYGSTTPPMPGHPDWTTTPVASSTITSALHR